jgi:hypothetical protein
MPFLHPRRFIQHVLWGPSDWQAPKASTQIKNFRNRLKIGRVTHFIYTEEKQGEDAPDRRLQVPQIYRNRCPCSEKRTSNPVGLQQRPKYEDSSREARKFHHYFDPSRCTLWCQRLVKRPQQCFEPSLLHQGIRRSKILFLPCSLDTFRRGFPMKKLTLQFFAVGSIAPEPLFWGPWVPRTITLHPLSGFRGRDDASSCRGGGQERGVCLRNESGGMLHLFPATARWPTAILASLPHPEVCLGECFREKKGQRCGPRAAHACRTAGNATWLHVAWHGVPKLAAGWSISRCWVGASVHHCWPKMHGF